MRGFHMVSLALLLLSFAGPAYAGRTVHFPDEAVGTLSIRPESITHFGYKTFWGGFTDGWQDHGPAAGEVTIPEGFAVRLQLKPAAADNLSWINDVPEDLIDAIDASSVSLGDEGFVMLSRLTGLRHLSLSDAGLSSAIATHLPRLRRLQYLWLGANADVGDEAMPAVAALPELQSIGVYYTGVTDAGLALLSRSKSIQAVYAGRTRITDAGVAALAQLPDLRALNLYAIDPEFRGEEPNPSITDAGLAHLGNCPNLEHLDVSGSELTDAGLERLAVDCPLLRRLELDNTAVTTEGLRHIGSFSHLERLRCYGTSIDDSAVEHFGSLEKLRQIIGDVKVGNAGAQALAALPSMEELSLSGACDDACMAAIAAMPSLKKLSVQHTGITDEGFALLANSPTLERVQITGNRMTTRCIETLATMPQLKHVGMMGIDARSDGKPSWKGLEGLQSLEKELWLCDCPPLGKDDFQKFASFQKLAQLRIEDGRPITDADLQHLRALDRLKYLELTSSVVTDEGLELLGSLPNLERIQISCLGTEKGLEALARSPRLRSLMIGSPDLTEEHVEQLGSRHPRLVFVRLIAFRLGGSEVSRPKSNADQFWREGTEEDRVELNALEGEPAPALAVTDWLNADDSTTLDVFRGKVVLVEFWGTWCDPCLARMPEVRRLHKTYADRGLIVVGLHSTYGADRAAEYVASNNVPWPVGVDDDTLSATAYAVPHYPSFYLIDRSGVLRMANPYDGDLEAAIQALLNE